MLVTEEMKMHMMRASASPTGKLSDAERRRLIHVLMGKSVAAETPSALDVTLSTRGLLRLQPAFKATAQMSEVRFYRIVTQSGRAALEAMRER